MPYLLGAVKPHVKAAADSLGPKHGIRVIYGWRAVGSVPNSDHPKGLALDFMTSSKAQGDALANDLITNASAYGVKYLVWWEQSWNPKRGTWVKYTSTTNKHRDHVHASFEDKAGATPVQNVSPVGLPGQQQIESLMDVFKDLNRAVTWLTKRENWQRIGLLALGAFLVVAGLIALSGKDLKDAGSAAQVVDIVKKAGKKVAK